MQRLLDDPGALKPLPALALADVERPTPLAPVPEPVDEQTNGNGYHGAEGPELADVTALQEAPPAPAPPVDLGPPTQPVPFALSGDEQRRLAAVRAAQPRRRAARPAAGAARTRTTCPAPRLRPTPTSRPSEWGRAVFESEPSEGEHSRFGASSLTRRRRSTAARPVSRQRAGDRHVYAGGRRW